MKRNGTLIHTIGLAGAALMMAFAPSVASAQTKSASDIYLDKCSVCHGADGAAKTAKGRKLKVKDVRETSAKLSAEQMADIVTKGKAPDMDAFGKEFTPDVVKQLVEYYRGLAKK